MKMNHQAKVVSDVNSSPQTRQHTTHDTETQTQDDPSHLRSSIHRSSSSSQLESHQYRGKDASSPSNRSRCLTQKSLQDFQDLSTAQHRSTTHKESSQNSTHPPCDQLCDSAAAHGGEEGSVPAPSLLLVFPFALAFKNTLKPKSMILTCKPLVSIMLSGFRSR